MVNHDRLNLKGNNQYIKVYVMRIKKEIIIVDIIKILLYSDNKANPGNLHAFLRWRKKFEINTKYQETI